MYSFISINNWILMFKSKCTVEKEKHSGRKKYINRDHEFEKEQERGCVGRQKGGKKREMIYSQKLKRRGQREEHMHMFRCQLNQSCQIASKVSFLGSSGRVFLGRLTSEQWTKWARSTLSVGGSCLIIQSPRKNKKLRQGGLLSLLELGHPSPALDSRAPRSLTCGLLDSYQCSVYPWMYMSQF